MSLVPDRHTRRSSCANSARTIGACTISARLAFVALVALALVLGTAGCGSRPATVTTATMATTRPSTSTSATSAATTEPAASATTTVTSTTTRASTATTPRATTSPTTTIQLIEPQLAYVVSISSTSPTTLQADYVEIYFGAEAIAMAKKDKAPILETDASGIVSIPNDYYLRNLNPQLRTLTLDAACRIAVLPADGGAEATSVVTVAKLRTLVSQRKRLMEITFNPAGTQIVKLTEFFLP